MADIRNRFDVEQREGVWYVIDHAHGDALPCNSKTQAAARLSFTRSYARYHGDIDLCHFPKSLTEPFVKRTGAN